MMICIYQKYQRIEEQFFWSTNEGNQKSKYLQNHVKRLDMGKHSFKLVITIYYIHCDDDLPLRIRIFFKSQWIKMPDLVRQSKSLWSIAVL